MDCGNTYDLWINKIIYFLDYTTTNQTNEESKAITDEPSANCLDEQIEDNKIKEYLQRSDTAVIFAEPVDKEEKQQLKTDSKQKSGQSVINPEKEKDHKNGLKTDKNRMTENGSPNQSMSDFCFDAFLFDWAWKRLLWTCSYTLLNSQENARKGSGI